jgi:predicted Fe-Mo cluster-binding NifX family protein
MVMRIAVPIRNDRISPVFDVAQRLLLVEVDGGGETGRTEVALEEQDLGSRARRLAELRVGVLICGAISRPLKTMLEAVGIEVIPQTCGNAEDVLRAHRAGKLPGEPFMMPGWPGRRHGLRSGQPLRGARATNPPEGEGGDQHAQR